MADQVEGRRRDQRDRRASCCELDQYRRDLVASITHDLKTPLTAIALNTELLESDGRLAEAGSHPVAAIRRSADRLASLVDDLLAMARAEEGADGLDRGRPGRRWCATRAATPRSRRTLRGVTFDRRRAGGAVGRRSTPHALARVFANVVGERREVQPAARSRGRCGSARCGDVVEFGCTDDGDRHPRGPAGHAVRPRPSVAGLTHRGHARARASGWRSANGSSPGSAGDHRGVHAGPGLDVHRAHPLPEPARTAATWASAQADLRHQPPGEAVGRDAAGHQVEPGVEGQHHQHDRERRRPAAAGTAAGRGRGWRRAGGRSSRRARWSPPR